MSARNSESALLVASRLHERGVERFNHHRPTEASALHRRALAALEGSGPTRDTELLRARIWMSLTESESDLHGYDAGLAALEQADQIAAADESGELLALAAGVHGWLETRAGHLAAALKHLDSAVTRSDSVSPEDDCAFRINRGYVNLSLGNLAAATDDLARVARVAGIEGLPAHHAAALHNLGYVSFLQGDFPRALSQMQAAAESDVNGSLGGVAMLDRARVLIEAGLAREADEALADAVEIFRHDRMSQDVGETELVRSESALQLGDIAQARQLAARARDRFRRRGDDGWRRSAELLLLQGDLLAGRPGRRLAEPAQRLATEFRDHGLGAQARSATLIAADALLRAGDHDQARRVVESVGKAGPNDPIAARLHGRLVRARIAVEEGATATGRREVREGLRELSLHQAKFGSVDMQAASAVHGRGLVSLDISLAMRSGRPAQIVAAAERSRAASRRLQPVRPPADEVTADLLSRLRKLVPSLREAEVGRTCASWLEKQQEEAARLQRQIRERAWTNAAAGIAAAPATLAHLMAALATDRSAMGMYIDSDDGLYLVTIDAVGAHVHALQTPMVEIAERVNRLRADLDALANPGLPIPIRAVVSRSCRAGLQWLDQRLRPATVGPHDPALQASGDLVLIPTGPLGAVPWGLLPSLRGVPVVVAPSGSAWLAARNVNSDVLRPITAVAGPGLGFADGEARGVAAIWGSHAVALSAEAANQSTFRAAMAASSILHVAAHGRHQMDSPLFSSVRLSDGPVFAYELDRTERVPEHIVLAACELGLATVGPGDEALGLTSVLLHWGARCVVSGMSRVADAASATVMLDYHRRLAGGARSSVALAEAIAGGDADSPAAFVCFGASYSAA